MGGGAGKKKMGPVSKKTQESIFKLCTQTDSVVAIIDFRSRKAFLDYCKREDHSDRWYHIQIGGLRQGVNRYNSQVWLRQPMAEQRRTQPMDADLKSCFEAAFRKVPQWTSADEAFKASSMELPMDLRSSRLETKEDSKSDTNEVMRCVVIALWCCGGVELCDVAVSYSRVVRSFRNPRRPNTTRMR